MGRQGARTGVSKYRSTAGVASIAGGVSHLDGTYLGKAGKKTEAECRGWRMGGVRAEEKVDVELPSFVDDMCTDIVVWEGGCNMDRVETNVKRVVREVAEEYLLPIETGKEEVLHLRTSRKKRNADRKCVKWPGVIFDDSLDFDMHWKSRLSQSTEGARGTEWCWGGAMGHVPGGMEKGL